MRIGACFDIDLVHTPTNLRLAWVLMAGLLSAPAVVWGPMPTPDTMEVVAAGMQDKMQPDYFALEQEDLGPFQGFQEGHSVSAAEDQSFSGSFS